MVALGETTLMILFMYFKLRPKEFLWQNKMIKNKKMKIGENEELKFEQAVFMFITLLYTDAWP